MPRLNRRRLLAGLLGGGLGLVALRLALPRLLRTAPPRPLTPAETSLCQRAFRGLDKELLWDSHAHLVGLGRGGTGCEVNPELLSHLHPWKRLQFDLYLAASGVRDRDEADAQYLSQLLTLGRHANPEGRLVLLAFDRYVDAAGVERPERTPFYTPNEYVFEVARRHRDQVVPAASVHPYREDALERLEACAQAGARAIKWLPNAMGIDPASPRCDPFYERLTGLDLPLITHAGHEAAVDAEESQELGNPLRLRRPLEAGVRVVVAHCAGTGTSQDLDGGRAQVQSFALFERLFDDPRYEEQLFADISSMTQVNRSGAPLRRVLSTPSWHARLLNGSDYPLPAVDPVIWLRDLVAGGYLEASERALLASLYDANPLLFDFVLKRSLRIREGGRVLRFADSVFETAPFFGGP